MYFICLARYQMNYYKQMFKLRVEIYFFSWNELFFFLVKRQNWCPEPNVAFLVECLKLRVVISLVVYIQWMFLKLYILLNARGANRLSPCLSIQLPFQGFCLFLNKLPVNEMYRKTNSRVTLEFLDFGGWVSKLSIHPLNLSNSYLWVSCLSQGRGIKS